MDPDILAAAWPRSGAAALGAVSTLLVVGRLLRKPSGSLARLWLALWATALAAGVIVATAGLAGHGALAWLGAGAASSGLLRMFWQSAARPP